MIVKVYIHILLCILLANTVNAQNAFQLRRNWVIGSYSGMWKDSTDQTAWQPINITVNNSTNILNPEHDSMVVVSLDNSEYYIAPDTSYWLTYAGPSLGEGGKLYADSTFIYHYISPSMSGGHMIYFIGKLVQSYASVNEQLNIAQVSIYPNPTSKELNIEFPNVMNCTLQLNDLLGQEIKSEKINLQRVQIDVDDLSDGIYFLKMKSEKGTITKKLIIH
jgi:hypothetical protein